VFQFESRGMRDLMQQAPPTRFEDIIALVALYRPGPMELIPDYTARKTGRQRVEYLDPRLEPILGPTYGVMVYQEQVMQIAQVIGGYTLGSADLLRRAMGKKKVDEMAEQRDIFVAGAEKGGLARAKASLLFDQMEKFAGYGFNKSHAAAYALVAYQTAWFKAHHPAAFMAANLTLVMDDTDKVRSLYEDTIAQGIAILPPDVNASNYRFEPIDTRRIRYGLGGVKGTGEHALEAIVAARNAGGPFRDLFDFCRRVDKRQVNRRVVEALIRAGAFDAVDRRRAALFASVGIALGEAERAAASSAQVSLFGEEVHDRGLVLVATRDWNDAERLQHEKSALGFYLSGHPYESHAAELAALIRQPLSNLQPGKDPVLIAGIVTSLRIQAGKRGKMAIVVLDDGKGSIEAVVYNEIFDSVRNLIREDELVVVQARIAPRMTDDGQQQGLRVVAERIFDLAGIRKERARGLRIACNGGAQAARLFELLAPFRNGECPIVIDYRNQGLCGEILLPDTWRVVPDEALLVQLKEWLAAENVRVVY
jgi:DNA polymerase-3 subunit alpha